MFFRLAIACVLSLTLVAISGDSVRADASQGFIGKLIGPGSQNRLGPVVKRQHIRRARAAPSVSSRQRNENRRVQIALNHFGFDAGPADGVMGAKSRAAAARFQATVGYPSTGVLTEPERVFLTSSYDRAKKEEPETQQITADSGQGTRDLLLIYRQEQLGPPPAPQPVVTPALAAISPSQAAPVAAPHTVSELVPPITQDRAALSAASETVPPIVVAPGAQPDGRVALVVGNSTYDQAPSLPNARNDAMAIADALRDLGFRVIVGVDLDSQETHATIRQFTSAIDNSEIALFFYAGHGMQVQGENYIIPTDSDIQREIDVSTEAVNLDSVIRQMDLGAAIKIVLLDACRDNPFENNLTRSMGATRSAASLGKGLAPIQAAGGALIGFATEPGAVAYDGNGRNSPFAAALLRHIATPDLEIQPMMTLVRRDVYAATGQRQRPWTTSSLMSEVYLKPAEGRNTDPTIADVAAWEAVAARGQIGDYASYLSAYPEGLFADQALQLIVELKERGEMSVKETSLISDSGTGSGWSNIKDLFGR